MEPLSYPWLSNQFLNSCLQQDEDLKGSFEAVTSFHVESGVPAGNNFGSTILRVTVLYKTKQDEERSVSLIIKAQVQNEAVDYITDVFGLAEVNFYNEFVPKLQEIIQTKIVPKSYCSPIKTVIVLEDLKVSGFSMADRLKQLDFNHCKQYMIAAAKLHAGGVALSKKYPHLPGLFPNSQEKFAKIQCPDDENDKMNIIMNSIVIGYKCLIKSIEKLNLDEYKPYIETMKKIANYTVLKDTYTKLFPLLSKQLTSFLHGDNWTTNMMFKYNELGNPIEIRLLDFQIFNYCSVVSDLNSFLWRSANNDVLEHDLDDLYSIYCKTLNSTLNQLGCEETLSIERLKREILEHSLDILMMVGVFLPLTNSEHFFDASEVFSQKPSEEERIKYYQGDQFTKKFPYVLKLVANQGVFEWIEKKLGEEK